MLAKFGCGSSKEGFFQENGRLIIIDDGVHFKGIDWIARAKWGRSND
jgi:hypothetical protein